MSETVGKRGWLFRERPGGEGSWSSWKVAELGITSLLVKAQDRPGEYEVEEIVSVESIAEHLPTSGDAEYHVLLRARTDTGCEDGMPYGAVPNQTARSPEEACRAAAKAEGVAGRYIAIPSSAWTGLSVGLEELTARPEELTLRERIQPALDAARSLAERVNQELDDHPAYSSAEDAIQEAEAALETEASEPTEAVASV